MIVRVTGVLQDGTPLRPGVPTNPRAAVSVPRGSDVQIVVTIVTPGNVAVPLTGDGTEVLLTVKKRPDDGRPEFVKAASVSGNVATFLIQPGDTRWMDPGLYGWDVWLTKDGLRDAVVPLSPFILEEANQTPPAQPPPPIVSVVEGDTDPSVIDMSPTDITGWSIVVNVATEPTPTQIVASIPVGTDGFAYFDTSVLPPGKWGAEVESTDTTPTTKTSPVFIISVREQIV